MRVEQFARTAASLDGIVDIDVVVHVVLPDPDQVTAEQVESQIAVLNEDYQNANDDLGQVPAVFTGVVGNPELRFRLAMYDPQGDLTTGITRTITAAPPFLLDDKVKSSATGGADAWDTTRYLNLWVCQLANGVLGYALGPGAAADVDGVVIDVTGFGRGGSAQAPYDRGRTATHEIGHYFDLNHIWGDKMACIGDDLVADTPQHQGPNYGTPVFPRVTCNNAPNGEMFMNYMDYVNDSAMFMFTKLQVSRMRTALAGPRATLIQNPLAATRSAAATAPVFTWD